VMTRGDRLEAIYEDDRDREMFLHTLGQACERTGWRVHSYVLMGNHYHLLLETPEANLCAGMKWMQGTYTIRHNARHKLRGHLFQGRYKAIIVEGEQETYFRTVSDYIHLNPMRAGLLAEGGQIGNVSVEQFSRTGRVAAETSGMADRGLGAWRIRRNRLLLGKAEISRGAGTTGA